MANNVKVVYTRCMTQIVAVFVDCRGTAFIVRENIVSLYGNPEVLIRSHLEVTLSFTYVDTVACVARKFI